MSLIRHDRTRGSQLDSFTAIALADWQPSKGEDLFGSEFGTFLERLQELSLEVRSEKFEPVMARLEGGRKGSKNAAELIRFIAHSLCRGLRGRNGDVINKSLQEFLFYCTNGDPDLPRSVFGKRLESFLHRSKGKKLIGFFLNLHLFNLIWLDLGDTLQSECRTADELKKRSESVERLCQSVVYASLRSERSSELDSSALSTLLSTVKRNLARELNSRSLSRRA
jgi:hypothetical protein